VPAQLADVPITVEILPEAQRMVDEADERWVAEHGLLADNPLLDEILHASDLLRTNPQMVSSFGVAAPRSGASFCTRAGISTTASTAIGSSSRSSPHLGELMSNEEIASWRAWRRWSMVDVRNENRES
jgi:hypothetical protein